ncbi:helix-turn-helix domain-containing protein [Clostridium niameyense]|uniref:Helix-turn-helix domain-containing protein n=1 Tax=Clostridium niameyense TaxID=1622073 RepID=A0A6M0RDK0_9CLOT|nr:helix-turn-helix domain-containing protein [Clostridium niameyense]NEZ47659.1 helix-turn-helix domain-containing protein [Clostridium niameyense]
MSRVSEKIKEARNKKGLTQKQLAKKLGVSEKFISEVELGKRIINQNIMNRISKILGEDINDITMSFEEKILQESTKKTSNPNNTKVKEVWNDALSSVLKSVPVYDYNLRNIITTKQLPIIGNKVEGLNHDKVIYLKIQDDDMIGFRIGKGDLAFSYITHEIENNGIFLIEIENERVIRQVKRLDSNKLLLINNKGELRTKTVNFKEVKIIAKLIKIEITL